MWCWCVDCLSFLWSVRCVVSWTSSSLCFSFFPSFFALCPSCVCLVFLDCAGLPHYGRWTARVDLSLDPTLPLSWGRGRGFMEWKVVASFALNLVCPCPSATHTLKKNKNISHFVGTLRMWWQRAMMSSINPQRGESNHLTHCSQDNGANVEIIGLRIDMQDTFSFNTINKCMW